MSRVVVTGIGTVSALGVGREALLAALREGKRGVAAIPLERRDPAELRRLGDLP